MGTGYSMEELAVLHEGLHGKWHPYDPKKPPDHFPKDWKPKPDDVPHVWLEPSESLVMQVLEAPNLLPGAKSGCLWIELALRLLIADAGACLRGCGD